MRIWKLIPFLLVLAVGACECDDGNLDKSCPAPEQLEETCIVNSDGTFELVSEEETGWHFYNRSRCQLGHTVCDAATKEIFCEGFFGPEEEETCNRIDDDCNGLIDDGLFLGVDHEENDCNLPGICARASKLCEDGQWVCRPRDGPVEEICDGLDNDCDGQVDNLDPAECYTGPANSIVDETTPCQSGFKVCQDGQWSPCVGQIIPETEVCDGVDNDCDGIIDSDSWTNGRSCGPDTSLGACAYGNEACVENESLCIGAIHPQNEICNDVDDDCDGLTDEELFQPCSTECGVGIEQCWRGGWTGCSAPIPQTEICDGIDNDCDGELDEGCPCVHGDVQTCTTNIVDENGVLLDPQCGIGVQLCTNGLWGACEFLSTLPEECNNWDDDCDGEIDNFSIECGDFELAGTGLCKLGENTCVEGAYQGCIGNIDPEEEICDLLDNDCDGLVDEDLDPDDKVDMVFVIDISGSMCPYIDALKAGIANYVAEFEDTEHLFGLVVYGVGSNSAHEVWTFPSLVDVTVFVNTLAGVGCNGSGIEPTYDVLYDLGLSSDPMGIGWREDATPYIIAITDEGPQTLYSRNETTVAPLYNNCQIGNCESGDLIEVFLITNGVFFHDYDTIVYGETERLIEIAPADEDRYTDILKDIFQNVCLY